MATKALLPPEQFWRHLTPIFFNTRPKFPGSSFEFWGHFREDTLGSLTCASQFISICLDAFSAFQSGVERLWYLPGQGADIQNIHN